MCGKPAVLTVKQFLSSVRRHGAGAIMYLGFGIDGSDRRIAEYSMDIAEIVLNMTVESVIE